MISTTLRTFQEEDLPFFLNTQLKSLLLYEPRLGKTFLTCTVLAKDPKTSNILVACSKNAFDTWITHFQELFVQLRGMPLDFRIVRGTKIQREKLWSKPLDPNKITIYLVTYASLLADRDYLDSHKLWFDTIIADEVHTRFRNRNTKTVAQFKDLVKKCRRFMALSGTLANRFGPADYWALLNIIRPQEFGSYWKFVGTFCVLEDGYFGKQIVGAKNTEAFHRILDRFARIRTREKCAQYMPKVQRNLKFVQMSAEQKKLYDGFDAAQFVFTDSGNIIISKNSLERYLRQRQLLVCPRIVDESLGLGGAFEYVLGQLEDAKEEENSFESHIVIFTAVRKALVHWEKALKDLGYSVSMLYGGLEPEEVRARIKTFTETKGIMLCTIQFAQAFSLATSAQCYTIGWDFDPNNNKQAEDRLVGQSGTHIINSDYLAYKETADEILAETMTIRSKIIYQTNTDPRKANANDAQPVVEG